MRYHFALAAAIVAGAAASADAGIITSFNQVVLGNLSTNHDTEGNAFIGGTLSGSAANFGTHLDRNTWRTLDVLTVGGNTTLGNINLNAGNYRRQGSRSGNFNNNGGGLEIVDASVTSRINGYRNELVATSNFLGGLAANSTIQAPSGQPGPLRFIANPGGPDNVAIFTITAAQLASGLVQQIDLVRNGASSIIINVTGSSLNFASGNFSGDWANSAVRSTTLWNFTSATSINLDRNWNGAILAPNASLTNSTAIDGSVFVASMTQNGEVHLPGYTGYIPTPGTAALMGLGGLFAARRRR